METGVTQVALHALAPALTRAPCGRTFTHAHARIYTCTYLRPRAHAFTCAHARVHAHRRPSTPTHPPPPSGHVVLNQGISLSDLPVVIPLLQRQQSRLHYYCNADCVPEQSNFQQPMQMIYEVQNCVCVCACACACACVCVCSNPNTGAGPRRKICSLNFISPCT